MSKQKVPDLEFPMRKSISVIAPAAMAQFKCAADRCEWTCCQGWRVPVNRTHAEIFLKLNESGGTHPVGEFLKKVRSSRRGKSKTNYYFDLPGTKDRFCLFLNEKRRCKLQERYGEDALCDTCLLFPRRLIQFDQSVQMTVSLACPETIRRLIMTEERLRLTTLSCAPDPEADWLDSEQIPNDALRELIRKRAALLENWTQLIYDDSRSFASRLRSLCKEIARSDPERKEVLIAGPNAETIGKTILSIEESFYPKASGFPLDVSNAIAGLLGGEPALNRLIGSAFVQADREFLIPFLGSRTRWLENYVALTLYSDALTEFEAYMRPDMSLAAAVRFTLTRLALTLNLLMLRLAAAAKKENGIRAETFMRAVYDIDRNFYQSPGIVEGVIRRLIQNTGHDPITWISGFLSGANEK